MIRVCLGPLERAHQRLRRAVSILAISSGLFERAPDRPRRSSRSSSRLSARNYITRRRARRGRSLAVMQARRRRTRRLAPAAHWSAALTAIRTSGSDGATCACRRPLMPGSRMSVGRRRRDPSRLARPSGRRAGARRLARRAESLKRSTWPVGRSGRKTRATMSSSTSRWLDCC
jgi:hypothetical protein